MKTIQSKIFVQAIIAMVLSLTVVTGIGIKKIVSSSNRTSEQIINLICQQQGEEVGRLFAKAEQSVKIISEASVQLESLEDISISDQGREQYLREIEAIMQSVIVDAVGSCVYFQFNPEVVPSAEGRIYSKTREGIILNEERREKIVQRLYEETNHWNTVLEPMWLEVCENEILSEKVVSYIRPVYWEDCLLAVVGMDIPLDTITDFFNNSYIYEGGYVCIVDEDSKLLFHPYEEEREKDIFGWEQIIKEERIQDEELFYKYSYAGKRQVMAYTELGNEMYLLVSIPAQELYQQRNFYLNHFIRGIIWGILIITYIAWRGSKKIVYPLKRLTKAVDEIANGNFQVELIQKTRDEIEELSICVQQVVHTTQLQMKKINTLAYKDPLTGVRSKIAYKEEVKKLDAQIKKSYEMFGVVVFDVNNLKVVNDMNGHEAGDAYLKNCCKLICQVYAHSPVFRIGGDEFVAFLKGQELSNALQLQTTFYDKMREQEKMASKPAYGEYGSLANREHFSPAAREKVLYKSFSCTYSLMFLFY